MKVDIKRIDKSLPLPKYETEGAVGFDFICRERTVIKPGEVVLMPTNIVVKIPKGYMLMIAPRSSTYRRTGLIFPHSVGIIDQDHCGEEDEMKVQALNPSKETITVERGDRVAQGIFVRIDQAEWEEKDKMAAASRGQFGSTGN